ncbi:hypothetical protein AB1Y20_018624 [Prymnesium parvum]|uniref:Uncharacterized protein n=1 Tax=Prymnesium parvum TaxID=97485 RepID=A0AB34JRZ1_PRYPA
MASEDEELALQDEEARRYTSFASPRPRMPAPPSSLHEAAGSAMLLAARSAAQLSAKSPAVHHPTHPVGERDVRNKATIDAEVSTFLGHGGELAAVEFVFVENVLPDFFLVPRWLCGGWGVGFGHAAVAYRRPDGSRILVNITRGTGEIGEGEMVEFWEAPFDYIYGVRGSRGKGGVFARSFCIIRMHKWDAHAIAAIDNYMLSMMHSFQADARTVSWHHCGKCINLGSWILPFRVRPSGNCSDWVSRALFLAGLLRRPHTFPKAALADMVEEFILNQPKDAPLAEVVYVRQAEAGRRERKWQKSAVWRSLVAPLYWFKTCIYWDLEPFANAVVDVVDDAESGGLRAVVRAGRARRPRYMRFPIVREHHAIATLIACGVWISPLGYPREETPALAAWLARILLALAFLIVNAVLY